MRRKFIFSILTTILFSVIVVTAEAQCAMCKATAESSLENGQTIARGINAGILYLMGIPYILLMLLAFVFFKKQIIAKIKSLITPS